MAGEGGSDYSKFKRRDENEAEFKSRVAREAAAKPAADARAAQERKSEEARRKVPGYLSTKAGDMKAKARKLFGD